MDVYCRLDWRYGVRFGGGRFWVCYFRVLNTYPPLSHLLRLARAVLLHHRQAANNISISIVPNLTLRKDILECFNILCRIIDLVAYVLSPLFSLQVLFRDRQIRFIWFSERSAPLTADISVSRVSLCFVTGFLYSCVFLKAQVGFDTARLEGYVLLCAVSFAN